MDNVFPYDVFLSHSSKDKPIVRTLAQRLKGDGLRVWLDEWEIKAGDLIPLKIEQGLQQSRVLLLIMSINAFDSEWVTLERHTALFRDPTNTERRFVPVRIDNCAIPEMLAQFSYIDFKDFEDEVYKRILFTCRPIPALVSAASQASQADAKELKEILLKILDFDLEQDLERYTLELRASLTKTLGIYQRWPEILKTSLENSELPTALLFVGDILSLDGDHDRAASFYNRASINSKATNSLKSYALSRIRVASALERSGKGEQALEILAAIVEDLSLSEDSKEDYWWAKYQEGICLKRVRRLNDAIRIFDQVRGETELHDRHKLLALYQLGDVDMELGRISEAKDKFAECKTKMVAAVWGHRRAYPVRGLGRIYTLQGRFREAETELREALTISEEYFDVRYRDKVLDSFSDLLVSVLMQKDEPVINLNSLLSQFPIGMQRLKAAFDKLRALNIRYIDEVDSNTGVVTDQVVKHEIAHLQGIWHATVDILLVDTIDNRNYILLRKRTSEPSRGKWEVSASGHRNVRETDTQAMIRKVKDELGIDIDEQRLNRLGECCSFKKVGNFQTKEDFHQTMNSFIYPSDLDNREYSSFFLYKVSNIEKKQLLASGRAIYRWTELQEAFEDARTNPQDYTSSFRQFNQTRLINKIVVTLLHI